MRRRLFFRAPLVLIAIVLGLAGAGVRAQSARVWAATSSDPIYEQALTELRQKVNGIATIDGFVGTGAAAHVIAALQRGEIDVAIVPPSILGSLVPAFEVYDLAFAFSDQGSMLRFPDTGIASQLSMKDLAVLDTWYGGSVVIAGRLPLRSPADFNGSRIVVRSGERIARQFAAVGASITALSEAETPAALRDGKVDAIETGWSEVATLSPMINYISETDHVFAGHLVVANIKRIEKLPSSANESLKKSLHEVGNKLKWAIIKRDEQAREKALDIFHPTLPKFNDEMRAEWRAKLAPIQMDAIQRIGLEWVKRAMTGGSRVFPAPAPPPPNALTWNAWFQTSPQHTETDLKTGTAYQFWLDLGRSAYPGALAGSASSYVYSELAKNPARDDVTLLVRPVLVGGILRPVAGSNFGPRVLRISRNRLKPSPSDEQRRTESRSGTITLQELATDLSVGAPLSWDVVARESGCARIAVSIWDATGVRPLDYLVVNVAVSGSGKVPDCRDNLEGGELITGMKGLLKIDPESPRPADAALHLFEIYPSYGEPKSTVAVYIDRANYDAAWSAGRDPVLLAWELGSPLSDFLGNPAKLPQSIAKAHASLGTGNLPYEDVVRQLNAALFSGRTTDDRQIAQTVRAEIQRIAQGPRAPSILVRYFGTGGEMLYLPLGLLAANATERVLQQHVTVIQPLPSTQRAPIGACFDAWSLAIPRRLDGARAEDAELLKRDDWRQQNERLTWYEDNSALLRFLSTPTLPDKIGEALVLLAHHGEGTLTYSASARPDRILNEEVRRSFGPGSVAVLAACSTAGYSDASRAFVQQLVMSGVQAFVLSPFQVNTTFGTHLAVNFVAVARDARMHSETPSIVDLHERALRRTVDSFAGRPGFSDMALEFQVIGNHELQLCAPSH